MTEKPSDENFKKLNAEHRRHRNMKPKEECRHSTLFEKEKDAKLEEAEKALGESESKYRTLLDMVSDALALIEIDTGQILDVNKTFLKLYGYSEEEVMWFK